MVKLSLMKKYCFFLIVFIIAFSGNALSQNYIPLPLDSNSLWKVYSVSSPTCSYYYSFSNLTVSGDSTINAIIYKKIIAGGVSGDSETCSIAVSHYYFSNVQYALIRNDTSAKKVYAYFNGADQLLYNFSLLPGDTIVSMINNTSLANLIVDSVSYRMLGDGLMHKHIWFTPDNMLYACYPGQPAALIEGIGSYYGLTNNLNCFENGSLLQCFSYAGTTVYTNSNFTGQCVNTTSIADLGGKHLFSVSPNPFINDISIVLSPEIRTDYHDTRFDVVNILGEIKFSYAQKFPKPLTKLKLDFLPKGIYFLKISNKESFSTLKIIKR